MEGIELKIDNILKVAINKINCAYSNNQESGTNSGKYNEEYKTKLVFPKYSGGDTRVSEQELRFAFIEAFNQCEETKDFYYSIETPTIDKYRFSKDGKETEYPFVSNDGESGKFDMVIYKKEGNDLKRAVLIEFKANDSNVKHLKKDLVKLHNPVEGNEEVKRYFIELFTNKSEAPGKKFKENIIIKKEDLAKHYPEKRYNDLNNIRSVNVRCICLKKQGMFDEYKQDDFPKFIPSEQKQL